MSEGNLRQNDIKEELGKGEFMISPLTKDEIDSTIKLAERVFYYMTSGEQNPNKYLIASLIPDKKADLSRNENLTDLEYFIAKDKKNNEVVGLVGLYRHESDRSDTAWLGWFCVDQSVRGKGVGGLLLRYNEERALERGFREIKVLTSDWGPEKDAQPVYEKSGYNIDSFTYVAEHNYNTIIRKKELKTISK